MFPERSKKEKDAAGCGFLILLAVAAGFLAYYTGWGFWKSAGVLFGGFMAVCLILAAICSLSLKKNSVSESNVEPKTVPKPTYPTTKPASTSAPPIPSPMSGAIDEETRNFTPRAQQVLALARKEADLFNHNFVGTEHLLLGLIKLGQGVAVNVLQKLGLELEIVRKEVEKQVGKGPDPKMMGNIPYTPRVKKVLALAAKEAKALHHTYVGTEHILLGLLREGDGVAGRVLKDLGISVEQTRQKTLKELDPNAAVQKVSASPTPTAEQTKNSQPSAESSETPKDKPSKHPRSWYSRPGQGELAGEGEWRWRKPAIHDTVAAFFWFNSTVISDAGHSHYGRFVYDRLLPILAPAKQYNREAWFALFDGDCLGSLSDLWERFRVEDRFLLNDGKGVGASLCYVVAVVSQSSRSPDFIDQEFRRATFLGYMGMAMLRSNTSDDFLYAQKKMSLVVALRIDGAKLKKISYGFHSDHELRQMGFEPYSEKGDDAHQASPPAPVVEEPAPRLATPEGANTIREEAIGEIVDSSPGIGRCATAKGCHVAWTKRECDKELVVVDGQRAGPGYDKIGTGMGRAVIEQYGVTYMGFGKSSLVFSANGEHVAYPVQSSKRAFVISDGNPGPGFDEISEAPPIFSADGKHIAYGARTENKWRMVVDGQPGPEFEEVGDLIMSADGLHTIYAARQAGKLLVVTDGRPGPAYETVCALVLSSDGKRVAYEARDRGKAFVVVDGQAGPNFEAIAKGTPIISEDGRRVVYVARRGGQSILVVDGEERATCEAIAGTSLRLSSDGERIAYASARGDGRGEKWRIVANGREGPEYDTICKSDPIVGADGHRLAYGAKKGGHWTVVLDGQEGPAIQSRGKLIFSANGASIAYSAQREGRWAVMAGGQFGPPFDGIGENFIISADGKRAAYSAKRPDGWVVVVDGETGPRFDSIGHDALLFSADGKHFAYAAQTGSKQLVVVDGQAGPMNDGLVCGPVFRSDGHLEYIMRRLKGTTSLLFRVTHLLHQ
jgi:hypothetical protein